MDRPVDLWDGGARRLPGRPSGFTWCADFFGSPLHFNPREARPSPAMPAGEAARAGPFEDSRPCRAVIVATVWHPPDLRSSSPRTFWTKVLTVHGGHTLAAFGRFLALYGQKARNRSGYPYPLLQCSAGRQNICGLPWLLEPW